MSAPASRAVKPGSTVYMSAVRIHKHAPTSFTVYADPIPVHAAHVYRRGAAGTVWTVEFHTIDMPRKFVYESMEAALKAAGELVGRKTGQEWKQRFTGPQRYAMGQQQCPRLMGHGMGVCGVRPEVGSVWCRWHPKGKDLE